MKILKGKLLLSVLEEKSDSPIYVPSKHAHGVVKVSNSDEIPQGSVCTFMRGAGLETNIDGEKLLLIQDNNILYYDTQENQSEN